MKEGSLEKACRGLTASWQKIGPKTQGVGLTEAWVSAELHSLETWSHAPLTCRAGCAAGDHPLMAQKSPPTGGK